MNLVIDVVDALLREAFGSEEEALAVGVDGILLRAAGPEIIEFANEGFGIHLETNQDMIYRDRLYIWRDDGCYLMISTEGTLGMETYVIDPDDIRQMAARVNEPEETRILNMHHPETIPVDIELNPDIPADHPDPEKLDNTLKAIHKTVRGRMPRISNDTIRKACKLLLADKPMSYVKIGEKVGISDTMVSMIANKRAHVNISDEYFKTPVRHTYRGNKVES